jgi:hypothetical protein
MKRPLNKYPVFYENINLKYSSFFSNANLSTPNAALPMAGSVNPGNPSSPVPTIPGSLFFDLLLKFQ